MATFNHKDIIDKIIANDGYYDGDPRIVRIVEYTNSWGNVCWGAVHEYEADPYRYDNPTPYISNPKVIFDAYA